MIEKQSVDADARYKLYQELRIEARHDNVKQKKEVAAAIRVVDQKLYVW